MEYNDERDLEKIAQENMFESGRKDEEISYNINNNSNNKINFFSQNYNIYSFSQKDNSYNNFGYFDNNISNNNF